MTQTEILRQTMKTTVNGSYSTNKGTLTINTLDGIKILSYNEQKIIFYAPFFDENICEFVSSKEYGVYDIEGLTVDTLKRILELFNKRLLKSYSKFHKYHNYER